MKNNVVTSKFNIDCGLFSNGKSIRIIKFAAHHFDVTYAIDTSKRFLFRTHFVTFSGNQQNVDEAISFIGNTINESHND